MRPFNTNSNKTVGCPFENKGSLGHRRIYQRGLPTGNFDRCKKVKPANFWSILNFKALKAS
jgi:hypothetical protein